MKDVNKVILVGRLGADPIQRNTQAGRLVVNFPLATSRKIRKEADDQKTEVEYLEETQWHQVVVWGRQGETCAQYLKKGSSVYVEGRVKSHRYDAKDGVQRMAFEVIADEVSFLGNAPLGRENSVEFPEAVGL
jgi:single-strand DNA-binding protein